MKISPYIVALFVVVAIVPTRKIYSQSCTPFPVANAVWNITDAHLHYFGSQTVIISPNPFATNATITLPNYPPQFSLQLFDQFGREMKFEYNTVHSGKNFTITIDKDEMPSGIIFFQLVQE